LNITKVADVDAVWPLIAPQIVRCIEKTPSFLSAGDLWQMCRSGQAFLLIAHDDVKIHGASIWQFQNGYGRHVFDCMILVGKDLDQWVLDIFTAADRIRADGGATAITATGRPGLFKILKKYIPGLKLARQSYIVEV
jgi:hypothetical protein